MEDTFELPTDLSPEQWRARVDKALEILVQFNGLDGSHHKDYGIDQAVRALTGCPLVTKDAVDYRGTPYSYEDQGESEEYARLVAWACDGEDGPQTYSWDTGIAP